MDEATSRRVAASQNRARIRSLIVAAALGLLAAAASAQASSSSGGIGGGTSTTSGCPDAELGQRVLKLGDCGADVKTLNWILTAKDFGQPPLAGEFEDETATAVEELQRSAALVPDGVADAATTAALVNSMPPQVATWYGPGFFGNETACGKVLTRRTVGVAHRTLPCGTRVVLRYDGHYVRTRVVDRGPFANQAKWDLTEATAERLGFTYTDEVRVAKLAR
jgi:hypothetical protein